VKSNKGMPVITNLLTRHIYNRRRLLGLETLQYIRSKLQVQKMRKHVFQTPARETSGTFQKLSYDVIGNCVTQNGRNRSEMY
jgi:hypothetical protein